MQANMLRPTGLASHRAAAAFRPAVRPVSGSARGATGSSLTGAILLQVPVALRRAPLVCVAEEGATAVAEPSSTPKFGVAKQTFQRGSVHKVRRILDVIRGRSYEEALVISEYLPYRACETILKVLMSAGANAKHNQGAMKTKLVVTECFADGGPTLKRQRPRAQGRGMKILKPTFHLTIRVEEREKA